MTHSTLYKEVVLTYTKPFVIDRKNFLFANTPKGATGSAVMFCLIQTAKQKRPCLA